MIRALVCMAVLGLACGFSLSKVGKDKRMKAFDLLEDFLAERISIGGGGKHQVAEARSAYKVRAKWDAIRHTGTIAVDPQTVMEDDECMENGEGCWFSLAMVRPEEVGTHVNWNTVDILEHRVIAGEKKIVNFMDLAQGVYDMKVCRIESAGNPAVVNNRCNCWKCDIEPDMSDDMWAYHGCAEGTHCDVVPVPVADVVPEGPAADIIDSSDEEDSVPDSPAAEIIDASAEDDGVPECPEICPLMEDCSMYLYLGEWVPNTFVTCVQVSIDGEILMVPNPNYPNNPYIA